MSRRRIFIKLSPSELKDLEEVMRNLAHERKYRARFRGNVLWESSEQHLSVKQLAKHYKVTERTIYRWFERFKENGIQGVLDKAKSFRMTPEQVEEIIKVSSWDKLYRDENERRRFRWSYRRIAQWVKEQWGITISHERLRQVIRKKLLNM